MALPVGSTVKVRLSFGTIREGRVLAVAPDSLTVDGVPVPQQLIPRTLITRVSRRVAPIGSSDDDAFRAVSSMKRAFQGAAIAGSAYLLASFYGGADGDTTGSNRFVITAALGAGVGALVGWFGTDWETVYET